jgi:hypothetical protein
VTATISSGPFAGSQFTAIQGSDGPQIDAETCLAATPRRRDCASPWQVARYVDPATRTEERA